MTPHWRTLQLHETHLRPQIVRGGAVIVRRALTTPSGEWECRLELGTCFGLSSATDRIRILPPPG